MEQHEPEVSTHEIFSLNSLVAEVLLLPDCTSAISNVSAKIILDL